LTRSPQFLAAAASTPQALATVTDRRFFEHLRRHGPSSRAAIAAATGLSKPTASEAATRLTEAGLINETGQSAGTRGRTAAIYDIASGYGHTLAVAVATGRAQLRATDLRGSVVGEYRVSSGMPQTREQLESALSGLFAEYRREVSTPCLAASVSQANPVAAAGQAVLSLPNAPFPEGQWNLTERFLSDCRGPVRVDNDVNWAALAERESGAMRGVDDFLVVYVGAGIGAALVMGGEVRRGSHGIAGEIAYLRQNGRTLMERLLGLGITTAGGLSLDMDRYRGLFAEQPDSPAAADFLELLGEAIGNTATLSDPAAVVLSGPLVDCPAFVDRLRDSLLPHLLEPSTMVTVSDLGTEGPLAGASLHASEAAVEGIWAEYRR
jgi:predicted NBD/HSP70 family sugar kinase